MVIRGSGWLGSRMVLLLAILGLTLSACGGGEPATGDPDETAGDSGATGVASEDGAGSAGEGRKTAVLFPGPIDDGAYNEGGYQGVVQAEEEGLDISFSEEVSQDEHLEVFRSYAQQGFEVVAGYGGQFMDAALRAAEEFPDVEFVAINGNESADNVTSIGLSFQDMGYAAGVLAANMTETGKVGIVAGLDIPIFSTAECGYRLGVASADSDVEVVVSVTGDFEDTDLAREAALAMIDDGTDVLWHFLDAGGAGVHSAAEDQGVMSIGLHADESGLAPTAHIASTLSDGGGVVYGIASGEFELSHDVSYVGVSEGIVEMGAYSESVPEDVIEEVNAAEDELREGNIDFDAEC